MILNILNELESTSSRLEKEAILRREQWNELFIRVLVCTLNPFFNYYIKQIPEYKTDKVQTNLGQALAGLEDLKTRKVTGNAAIEYLRMLLSSLSERDAEVLERVIQRDLKCGVSVATVNKIFKELIPEYPCMLASAFDEKLINKFKFPAMCQLKEDGVRMNAIVVKGKVEFRTRNGKQIHLLGNLEQEFLELANGRDCVFDGELLVQDSNGVLNRQTGNGIINKAVKETISHEEASKVVAVLWDVIDYAKFVSGFDGTPYHHRFEILENSVLPNKIQLVPFQIVQNIGEARKIFDGYLAQGQEGIILKDLQGPWENKRSKSLVKMKAELECDLEIVGCEEGTGKNVGRLGALVCRSRQDNTNTVEVSVGSGLNDATRSELWSVRDSIVGKVVAVKYNARISEKDSSVDSLFLPIFLYLREDKTQADLSSQIK